MFSESHLVQKYKEAHPKADRRSPVSFWRRRFLGARKNVGASVPFETKRYAGYLILFVIVAFICDIDFIRLGKAFLEVAYGFAQAASNFGKPLVAEQDKNNQQD